MEVRCSKAWPPVEQAARNTLLRLAIAYGCAGVAQAIVITSAVLLGGSANYTERSIWLPMLMIMALPIIPTIIYVLASRPMIGAIWIVVALGATLQAHRSTGPASTPRHDYCSAPSRPD